MADMISYKKIQEIANMTVDEYRASMKEGNWFTNLFGGIAGGSEDISDEMIQAMIDHYKEAVNNTSEYKSTWAAMMSEAEKSYEDMYENSLDYLKMNSGVTDDQWDEAYNASVSDNYATGMDGVDLENITIPAGDDNISIDWSELQTMKKTQLSNGTFKRYAPADVFDDSANIGDTRNICGGTITYLGRKSVTYDRGDTVKWYKRFAGSGAWKIPILSDMSDKFDYSAHMVHYEGVLGSFDYNADEFALGYWEAEVNGNKVRVPVLHYINDGATQNGFNKTYNGFLDGEHIKIPEGLKSLDYTFADTGIITMPEIPKDVISAHCAFMDCKQLVDGCDSAKTDSGINAGRLTSKPDLQDTSWMFSGCENMRNYFPIMSENTVDGRYMYSACKSLGWDGETIENGEMKTSFKMPDLSKIRYANAFWLQNMFDGCDDAVINKIADFLHMDPDALKNGKGVSEWTDDDGLHHNRYDRLVDGSYNPDLEQDISNATARVQILQLIDKDGKGLTGVASDTANLASMGVQITSDGTFADNSVWARFRQSDFDATFGNQNEFGEILNHAIPAVGTYAVSKALLNKMTDGKHKALSTIGAVAVAAIPQVVGYGNTLTPVLDWTANAVGTDTKVGNFLKTFSDKLKGQVTYHTAVSELNVDETFESVQESATKYAENQVASMMTSVNYQGKDVLISSEYDVSSNMKKNGEYLAQDANLLFIACEPEENLKSTITDSVMKTSMEALRDKMDLELQSAGSDTDKISEIREKYSGYYMTILYNLDAYDNAAKSKLDQVYATDPELKAQATNGLEKVMRCTAKPLYDQMNELQEYWQKNYGEDFFTDKQLNESEMSTKSMSITGLGTFNDYDPNKDYSDQSDTYVEKLEVYQKALVEAVQNASSQEEIDAAYASYYETAYGWALDEAEAHGVILDKRGAQTTAEKDSFAEYIAKVESEQQAEFASEDADDKTNDSETATQNNSAQSSDMAHQTSTAASGGSDLPETAEVMPDGIIFDAEYYAKMNPDVTQAVGNDFNRLFTHYVAFGIGEGRAAYEGDSGQTLPADYTEDIINEYKESFGSSCAEYAEEQAQKASERAAMVGVEDADTAAAEKAAISELNI